MMKRKTVSHDHRDKYSSYREKNSANVKSTTKEPNQENLERFKNSKVDEGFERKNEFRCYLRSSTGHFRSNYPQLKQLESIASVNWVISMPDNDLMSPYTVIGEVNGFKMLDIVSRNLDIVSRNGIRQEMLIGEHIWDQQRFDEKHIRLPLTEVELKGKFGQLKTKAVVAKWIKEDICWETARQPCYENI
ncbi:hypothetical protein AVEN_121377-1 [Araneus ventricosus]|uniref:Uncharacterized protein n=1 Tax=Araneus ventricosus TaxID=182803 RepID=A0A4Y2CR39_ARAVE|nr:hypothetical protein AVEN_121377-1 [Araneus ventricosus]